MPTISFLKGEFMQQPQLEAFSQIPELPRTKNARYGQHPHYTQWVDAVLATPSAKDSYGMLAKDILTLAVRSGETRQRVCLAWGTNSAVLSHALRLWAQPLTEGRKEVWLRGCHLLDLNEQDLKTAISAAARKRSPAPAQRKAAQRKQNAPAVIATTIEEAALPPQPAWAPWAHWVAGFFLGCVTAALLAIRFQ